MISCKNSQMLAQARQARFQPKLILQILLFIAVYSIGNAIASVILVVPTLIGIFTDPALLSAIASGDASSTSSAVVQVTMTIMEQPWILLISLFAAAVTTYVELITKDGLDTITCPAAAMVVILPLIKILGG